MLIYYANCEVSPETLNMLYTSYYSFVAFKMRNFINCWKSEQVFEIQTSVDFRLVLYSKDMVRNRVMCISQQTPIASKN